MNVKSILAAGALALLASTAWAADTIKIGNIVVTAGFLKSVGEPTLTAVDIAVDEINAAGGINGKPIELIRFDTGSDPKQASVGARKLAQDDEVLAIVGPVLVRRVRRGPERRRALEGTDDANVGVCTRPHRWPQVWLAADRGRVQAVRASSQIAQGQWHQGGDG
jgi:hypothetical protein